MMATYTQTITAGALVRGQVKRALKSYCFARGYPITIGEDKGFFESLLMVEIEVPDNRVNELMRDLEEWGKSPLEETV